MIKRIITPCLLTIGLYSCSKDDDSTNENGTKKYVDKVTFEQEGVSSVTNIIYNDAMQVTQYVMDDITLSLEYEDGRVVAVKDGTATDPYTLYYTNGILSGLKSYQLYYPVTYNDQDHSYTMDDINYAFGLTGRDVLYAGQPGNYKESFTYDTTRKAHCTIWILKTFTSLPFLQISNTII